MREITLVAGNQANYPSLVDSSVLEKKPLTSILLKQHNFSVINTFA